MGCTGADAVRARGSLVGGPLLYCGFAFRRWLDVSDTATGQRKRLTPSDCGCSSGARIERLCLLFRSAAAFLEQRGEHVLSDRNDSRDHLVPLSRRQLFRASRASRYSTLRPVSTRQAPGIFQRTLAGSWLCDFALNCIDVCDLRSGNRKRRDAHSGRGTAAADRTGVCRLLAKSPVSTLAGDLVMAAVPGVLRAKPYAIEVTA